MIGQKGRLFAVIAALTGLGAACAADPGDASKASATAGDNGSSGSSGGTTSSSSSGMTPISSSSSSSSGSPSSSGQGSSSSSSSSSSSGVSGSSSSGVNPGSSSSSSGGVVASSSGGMPEAGASSGSACGNNKSVSISVCTNDSGMPNSSVSFQVAIGNAGLTTVNLSDVTIRYWFSADGNDPTGMLFTCDNAQNGNVQFQKGVTGTFSAAPAANQTPTSDTYLQLSFDSTAGMLGAFATAATVQARFHGGPATNQYMDVFTETNDYSFDAMAKCSNFASTQNITAYVKGSLVWGCEPSGTGAASSSGGASDGGSEAAATTGVDAATPIVDASVGGG